MGRWALLWLYGRCWHSPALSQRFWVAYALAEMALPGLRVAGGMMWQSGKPPLRFA